MKIRLIDFGVTKEHCPFRPHENDAGADVYIPFDCTLKPGDIIKIPLGFDWKSLMVTPDMYFPEAVWPSKVWYANFRRLTLDTEEKSMLLSAM